MSPDVTGSEVNKKNFPFLPSRHFRFGVPRSGSIVKTAFLGNIYIFDLKIKDYKINRFIRVYGCRNGPMARHDFRRFNGNRSRKMGEPVRGQARIRGRNLFTAARCRIRLRHRRNIAREDVVTQDTVRKGARAL